MQKRCRRYWEPEKEAQRQEDRFGFLVGFMGGLILILLGFLLLLPTVMKLNLFS